METLYDLNEYRNQLRFKLKVAEDNLNNMTWWSEERKEDFAIMVNKFRKEIEEYERRFDKNFTQFNLLDRKESGQQLTLCPNCGNYANFDILDIGALNYLFTVYCDCGLMTNPQKNPDKALDDWINKENLILQISRGQRVKI